MSRRRPLGLLATCLTLATCAGCGSSDSVIHVAGAPHATISKAALDHWMRATVGADFRQSVGVEGPAGLASEPADYSKCFAAVKLIGPRSFFNQLRLDRVQVERICRELHRSVKAQALSFLISAQWTDIEAAEQGVKVSHAELEQAFARYRAHLYPTAQDLHKYLTDRHWSLADVLFQLKHDLLVNKLLPRFQQAVAKAGGGEREYAKLATEHYNALIAKTSCIAGYVVPGCREYHGPPTVSPAPAEIITQLVPHPTSR